jgi:acetyl-CoA carboxylase biotin carboxyl carrier protein
LRLSFVLAARYSFWSLLIRGAGQRLDSRIQELNGEAGMNLKELKELIELISEKGFAEFEIERQGFRLRISRFNEPSPQLFPPVAAPVVISPALPGVPVQLEPAQHEAPSAPVTEPAQTAQSAALHVIKSPIVGTFYRAPSPSSPSFVNVGDRVEPETVVCIIEAMKLMNEIQAEVGGVIMEIYPQNGQAVEYGQPLFGIKT